MLEAKKVSAAEIRAWREQILNGDLSDVGEVYQRLAKRGYHYAQWAYGVASADTITGNGALEFMQAVAKEHHHILTDDETNKIRRHMALGYLEMLEKKAGSGSVSQDITYQQMKEFHIKVFDKNNVDINYWTLYEPMRLIERYTSGKLIGGREIKGEQVVEEVWEAMWATEGTSVSSWAMSFGLAEIMRDAHNGYIYIDKLTGKPHTSAKITAIGAGLGLAGQMLIWSCYKKVPISSADQALAKKWVDNTSRFLPAKDYWAEFGKEGMENLWYKDYGSPADQYTGRHFTNQKTTNAAKQQLKFNWDVAGGKAVTQWIMAAILNTNSINPSNPLVSSINHDNFADKGMGFVFDPVNGHRKEVAGQPGKFEFKYQLAFIDELPEKLLTQLQEWEKQGNQQMVSLYLNALMQLNPVVVLNPDKMPTARKIDDVGEDWIKVRTWMIQEMRLAQADEYNQMLSDKFHEHDGVAFSRRPSYLQQKSLVESIRKQYGFGAEDAIVFRDEQTGQSWSTGASAGDDAHQVVMLGNGTTKVVGGDLADVIFGSKGNDDISGGDGDDYLFGGAGNDTLRGGAGNDILAGGDGNDKYYFNSGDGKDKIYDSDGKGSIFLNDQQLSRYKWTAKENNVWISSDEKWRISVDQITGDLMIQSLENKNDILTIVGWEQMSGGRLGIRLPKFKDNNNNNNKTNKIVGDWRTKIIHKEGHFDLDKSLAGRYYWGWKNRNAKGAIVDGVIEKGFEDVIKGTDGADEINGLDGGDAIDGMGGNDIILGGDGTDLLVGGGGSDIIKGGAGDDFIWANSHLTIGNRVRPDERWKMPADGKELIYAGPNWGVYINQRGQMITSGINKGSDDAADVGGDYLYGGDGNDHIVGGNLNDYIEGDSVASGSTEQGDDTIYGMAGNDHIVGGKGNDYIHGDGILRPGFLNSLDGALHGDDYIDGGDGDDEIVGGGGNDVIIGGNGDDYIYGDVGSYKKEESLDGVFHGDDYIDGGDGDDKIAGGGGNDVIIGGNGDDNIYGDADSYEKGEMLDAKYHGNDTIYGGAGNDQISGGGGDDYLYGGDGDDIIWGDASGTEPHPELNGNDHIWGDAGNDILDGGYGDDVIHGGDDDDKISGGAGNDELYGDDGDDTITGDWLNKDITEHGNDFIDGGAGNDKLAGGGGDDWIIGGDGDDVIWGDACEDDHELNTEMAGNDYLSGGAGNDTIFGGYGDDTIDGGTGDDTLLGGGGRDTIYGGDGNDQISGDFISGIGMNVVATDNSYNDTIYAGNGNDLVEGQLGDDLIYGGAGNDHLFGDQGYGDPKQHRPEDKGNDTIYGEEGDDYIDGGYGNDFLDGGTGNDTIFGGGGNDVLHGGDGNDFLSGGNAMSVNDADTAGGNDIIYGGAGNDTILGGEGNDVLHGDEGDDHLRGGNGNDRLYGGDGRDWLYGGKGNDYLNGGAGDDVFVFNKGDGVTTIEDYSGKSTVIINVPLDNLSISAYEKGIKVTNGVNGDAIYLVGYYLDGRAHSLDMNNLIFAQPNGGNSYITRSLQRIVDKIDHHNAANYDRIIEGNNEANELFGTVGKDLMYGYGGNDILHGNKGNDLLDGGDGNDILYGDAGDDQLFGGAGKDILEGGSGNDLLIGGSWEQDRYVFRAGHGRDEVFDQAANAAQGDILDFVDYRSNELRFNRNRDDLIIGHIGSNDQVRLDNWFAGESFRQYQIHTADGVHYTAAQVQQLVGAMAAFSGGSSEGRIWAADEVQQLAPQTILAANCG
ncbi:calcium-binding protein [Snodgrassella alvi]|uniref:calcium-binding protein n=1 Tax=Snodgrassella alvi TaxID=1196083 RepID=UPI000C1EFD98|nr:calcium-binding protein [Snodgrassella alvi]PIT47598.1 hypothetical protein BHC51_05145 [Snodgrassella alvi]